ncbi:hypothetical protein CK203_044181 [Vitis vinifera]|uniref:Retrotransposon gag domain-containing protein n=1 Tax=Vitis vinifera TaxID=29760 RepID=A0A438I2L5_VITVI|nr:hypothetical protein CK203_044181 [Vitis vinifera]
MDSQPSRHVVLEDTPSDIVMPPVIPVQMPATQTCILFHMIGLERRIGQMRDPDEMIPWDDLGDVPVATLPVGFRMPDIERYTGVGCPRIHLRLYSTVMRALGLDEAQLLTLFPLSLSGMTQRWEKAAEMIERPTERDQMGMFLRSLHPRFARHLIGVPFQDFRSLVQALFDVDDGISRGLWSDITHSPDTEGKGVVGSFESYGGVCSADFQHRRPGYRPYVRSLQTPRSDFPPLQHRHPHPVQQYPSVHPHTVTVRPSFQFQHPQTSIPRHEQSRPHRRR